MTTTAPEKKQTLQEEVAARFAGDTADHQLHVLHDDGLYKHLLFKKPGTGWYWYELVTWPGILTLNGDMGTFVFQREDDMMAFFRSNPDRPNYRINPHYWSEKIQSAGRVTVREFSADVLRPAVEEYVEDYIGGPCEGWQDRPLRMGPDDAAALRAQVKANVLPFLSFEHEAMETLRDFEFEHCGPEVTMADQLLGAERNKTFRFEDYYELPHTDWTFHFLWACHGIVTGIEQYDVHVRAQAEATVSVTA